MRLLTLTGPGGIGKTRLALEVATSLSAEFQDRTYFVELDSLHVPELLSATIAKAFQLQEADGKNITDILLEFLHSRRLLLLLDNFEHLLVSAPLVSHLLESAKDLKILVISREVLNLRGEHEYPIKPLELPNPKELTSLTKLVSFSAIELFRQRGNAVRYDFTLTEENKAQVIEICQKLEGIPLALELAAVGLRTKSIADILIELSKRLETLSKGPIDSPIRHQSLRATLDWGFDLLNSKEKELFRRLAVFNGGCTLDGVQVVCAENGLQDVTQLLLESLAHKQLVQLAALPTQESSPERRYRMLETIREYALERLGQSGEIENIRQHYTNYYLNLAEKTKTRLEGDSPQIWIEHVNWELDNFRGVLSYTLADTGESLENGARMCSLLWRFWHICGYFQEGRNWVDKALTKLEYLSDRGKAEILATAGRLARSQGDLAIAKSYLEASREYWLKLDDPNSLANLLNVLGIVAKDLGDYHSAIQLMEESLILKRELDDKKGIATALNNLGLVAMEQGQFRLAYDYYSQSLALDREVGNISDISISASNLAIICDVLGKYEEAKLLFEESLRIKIDIGDKSGLAMLYTNLGLVALHNGEFAEASRLMKKGIALHQELGEKIFWADALINLGEVSYQQNLFLEAEKYYRDSLELRQGLGEKRGLTLGLYALARVILMLGEAEKAQII